MKVYTEEKIPIKSWASQIEDAALEQAKNLANLPIAQTHVALMPDAHMGFGMPIGGVLFTDGAVVPNAVGVDIGCGVALLETSLYVDDLMERLQEALNRIAETIPTGVHQRQGKQVLNAASAFETMDIDPDVAQDLFIRRIVENVWWTKALPSLGTLGGGNHFIEFQSDEHGKVYVMLHSGSRGLGKMIGDHYHKVAVANNHLWHTQLPTDDLAFFPLGTEEHSNYMQAMNFGLAYATANRTVMLRDISEIISTLWPESNPTVTVNVHHNYAAWENHKGRNGVVHRKGAIRARVGETLLIPGSMGTFSYIGKGLGNPDSFNTCQHGAGRAHGRKESERLWTAEDLAEDMKKAGVLMAGHAAEAVDESPRAYKDIDLVMRDSIDLVESVKKLRPLGVVKG